MIRRTEAATTATGRTNREIGETLFMSEETASVHVSRILAGSAPADAWRPPPSRTVRPG